MATLKTDFTYNDDDFVERDGKLFELTVTITLSEYRNLVLYAERFERDFLEEQTKCQDLRRKIEELERENNELKKTS